MACSSFSRVSGVSTLLNAHHRESLVDESWHLETNSENCNIRPYSKDRETESALDATKEHIRARTHARIHNACKRDRDRALDLSG